MASTAEEKVKAESERADLEVKLAITAEEKVKVEAERAESVDKLAAAEAKIIAYKKAQEEHLKSKDFLAAQVCCAFI